MELLDGDCLGRIPYFAFGDRIELERNVAEELGARMRLLVIPGLILKLARRQNAFREK